MKAFIFKSIVFEGTEFLITSIHKSSLKGKKIDRIPNMTEFSTFILPNSFAFASASTLKTLNPFCVRKDSIFFGYEFRSLPAGGIFFLFKIIIPSGLRKDKYLIASTSSRATIISPL